MFTELESETSSVETDIPREDLFPSTRSQPFNRTLHLPASIKVSCVERQSLDIQEMGHRKRTQDSRTLPHWLTHFVGYALKVIQTIPEQRVDEEQVRNLLLVLLKLNIIRLSELICCVYCVSTR